jgi:uncharacterized membrane protein YkoI
LRYFLPRIELRYKAQVIDVAFREIRGRLFYEMKLLSDSGRIFVVSVDAASGRPRPFGF